jgi:hypothetical protein
MQISPFQLFLLHRAPTYTLGPHDTGSLPEFGVTGQVKMTDMEVKANAGCKILRSGITQLSP